MIGFEKQRAEFRVYIAIHDQTRIGKRIGSDEEDEL